MPPTLISVIVRSMARPHLADAVASIRAQTYADLEIVLVDATGGGQALGADLVQGCRCTLLAAGQPLRRPAAANAGLEGAQGAHCIFLDEDDRFDPDHIARLADALAGRPDASLAYSGVRVTDGGAAAGAINQPFSVMRLLRGNFIPTHAALFAKSLFDDKRCRFDETLEIYEDWDFWIQCAQHTPFVRVDAPSAAYEAGSGMSGAGIGANSDEAAKSRARAALNAKWAAFRDAESRRLRALLNEGMQCLRIDAPERAERALRQAIAIDDRDVDVLNLLGVTQLQQGRAQEAIPLLSAACDLCRTVPGLFHNLGLAYRAAGLTSDAEAAFHEARRIEQRNSIAQSG